MGVLIHNEGLPTWLVVVLNIGAIFYNKMGDVIGVYHGLADFVLTTGAMIVMGFKLYELYKKHIKK